MFERIVDNHFWGLVSYSILSKLLSSLWYFRDKSEDYFLMVPWEFPCNMFVIIFLSVFNTLAKMVLRVFFSLIALSNFCLFSVFNYTNPSDRQPSATPIPSVFDLYCENQFFLRFFSGSVYSNIHSINKKWNVIKLIDRFWGLFF